MSVLSMSVLAKAFKVLCAATVIAATAMIATPAAAQWHHRHGGWGHH